MDKGEMKKVEGEEAMVCLDNLVLEQCVSLMKQKKFTNDLSLESVSKLFAGVLQSNHRKLKVSVKSKFYQSHDAYEPRMAESYKLSLSNQRWEGDLNLTTENMTESQLKSIFKEIFIRFKCFRCISYESSEYFGQYSDWVDILSQVIISDKEYRPIKMKQLKFTYIENNNISSLISSLSSIVKEIDIHEGRDCSCEDLCTAISACSNLRGLVLTGNFSGMIAPLRDCVKLLKHLKHFQFSVQDNRAGEKFDSEWLFAAFKDNTNLHSLSFDRDGYNFDLANLCAPTMRSIMSRLRHLEIKGGYLGYNDWTESSKEMKQKMQQILSSIHVNGCMKVVCGIASGYISDIALFIVDRNVIEAFTSMFMDIFGTYLKISNRAARQIDLFIDNMNKVFSICTIYAIDEMLKKEEYYGMTVDRSNGQTIIRLENAKLVLHILIYDSFDPTFIRDPTFIAILADIVVYCTNDAITTEVVFDKIMDRCTEAPPTTVFRFLMKVAVEEKLTKHDRNCIGQLLCRCLQAELIRAEALKGIADYARLLLMGDRVSGVREWVSVLDVWQYMAEVLVSAMLCDGKLFDGTRPSLDDFAETFEIAQQDSLEEDSRKPHVLLTLVLKQLFESLDDKSAASKAFLEMKSVSVETPMLREALKETTVEGGNLFTLLTQ